MAHFSRPAPLDARWEVLRNENDLAKKETLFRPDEIGTRLTSKVVSVDLPGHEYAVALAVTLRRIKSQCSPSTVTVSALSIGNGLFPTPADQYAEPDIWDANRTSKSI